MLLFNDDLFFAFMAIINLQIILFGLLVFQNFCLVFQPVALGGVFKVLAGNIVVNLYLPLQIFIFKQIQSLFLAKQKRNQMQN
jgi:hypothetical protein